MGTAYAPPAVYAVGSGPDQSAQLAILIS